MDNDTIDLSKPERVRLRYDGIMMKEATSIDELFTGGESPLYYLLEENGTATMAVYIPKFSEHEIIIDLAPEGEENISETEEKEIENEETRTKNESTEPAESSPAFELGLAAAGLAAAYVLKKDDELD